MHFGVSVGAHYRVLRAISDVESLLAYFVSKQPTVIELSLHDRKTYDLYYDSYRQSASLRTAMCAEKRPRMHLHLPRKDWGLIGVQKIREDVATLDSGIPLSHLIMHQSDYELYGRQFLRFAPRLLIENELSSSDVVLRKAPAWACDINHFFTKDSFDADAFDSFLRTNGSLIREFHFAWGNHDLFTKEGIFWLRQTLYMIGAVVPPDVVFVFEGTDKTAADVTALQRSLDTAFALIGESVWNGLNSTHDR